MNTAEAGAATSTPADPWSSWLGSRAAVRARRGLERRADPPEPGAPSSSVVDLAANDYLGLAVHPDVRAAAARIATEGPVGARASRVVTGTHPAHADLESAAAALADADAALAFSSGYTANLGVLGALAGPGTAFLLDEHAHASLRDGAALAVTARSGAFAPLAGASVTTVEHNRVPAFRAALNRLRTEGRARRIVLVVESLYSVLGDEADLPALAALAAEHGALLVVDEAHSLGVVPGGSRTGALGLWAGQAPVVVTATCSKALGGQGGLALFGGPDARSWRDHVLNTARTFVFDTALAPVLAASAAAACRIAATGEPAARLARARETAVDVFTRRPELAGHVEVGAGAVHSIRMPGPEQAVAAAAELRAHGVLVGCFRPPSVPDGIARLRVSVTTAVPEPRLRAALEAVASVAARAWGASTGCPFAHGDPRPEAVRGDHLRISDPADLRRVLTDPGTFASDNALTAVVPLSGPARRILAAARFRLPPVLASAGGEEHRAVRRVVAPFFSPAKVREARGRILATTRMALTAALADTGRAGGAVDLATTVAAAVPARVMSALTGVPNPPEAQLHRWSADSLELFWGWPDEDRQLRLARSAADFHRWLRGAVVEARGDDAQPGNLFAALHEAGVDDERIVSLGYFLVIAGQETTRLLISTALTRALADPARWAALGAGADGGAGADAAEAAAAELVAECLRTSSSVPTWRRLATADVRVGEHEVRAGDELLLHLSGEQHDDARLAFGFGLHRCLGAGLAELETALVVREVARLLPDARLTGPPATWLRLLSFQAPQHVLVTPGPWHGGEDIRIEQSGVDTCASRS